MPQLLQAYEISRSIECPHCEANQIELYTTPVDAGTDSITTRECDLCGTTWEVVLFGGGAKLTRVEKDEFQRGYALLKYSGGGLPHYIVIPASLYFGRNSKPPHDYDEALRHIKYFYDEHTCPTNYYGVTLFSLNGDTDPHGIYAFERFVSNQELKEKHDFSWQGLAETLSDCNSESFWCEVFPELLTRQRPNP